MQTNGCLCFVGPNASAVALVTVTVYSQNTARKDTLETPVQVHHDEDLNMDTKFWAGVISQLSEVELPSLLHAQRSSLPKRAVPVGRGRPLMCLFV